MSLARLLAGACCAALLTPAWAEPLSKTQVIDFYADIPSRSLQGLATRSDGRLLPGPQVTELQGLTGAGLLWSATPDGDGVLLGTGPEGRLLRLTRDGAAAITTKIVADLTETHVFTALRLPDGSVLAGTSPQGTLVLLRDGKVVARTALPVDSIFDLVLEPGAASAPKVLVGTGNPGRIYRVTVATFAAAGDQADKVTDTAKLAARGFELVGEIRDRNARRLLRLADGRLIVGSAPKGNVYAFPAAGGLPRIMFENRNAEVCDLLPWAGGFYAAVTFGNGPGDVRVANRQKAAKPDEAGATPDKSATDATASILFDEPARPERFTGRSQLLWFPDGGFPETVVARNNVAFYRLAPHAGLILIAGGEQGELLGYDPVRQRSLTFAGVPSAQLNGIIPLPGAPEAFVAIANNPTAVHRIDFAAAGPRSAETRRIDLGAPATIGLLRFGAGTHLPDGAALQVAFRTSFGSDEAEGWSHWLPAVADDGGWRVPDLRGRHVQVRVTTASADFALDRASLHFLRQNRRPQLQEFRLIGPNAGLVRAAPPAPTVTATLGQIIQPARDDAKGRNPLLASQVVPVPGAYLAFWNVNDADDDNLLATFSLRVRGTDTWTDLAVANTESYVQFDTTHLAEGTYETRLVVTEAAPRPVDERLGATFETDDLIIDRTAPEITDAKLARSATRLRVTVAARDALSLLGAAEFTLNNGVQATVEQPDDGILDGHSETFTLDLPLDRAAGATSLEVVVYDALGNSSARRLTLQATGT